MANKYSYNVSLLTDFDIHLFREGNHYKIYEKLGSHVLTENNEAGTYFAVWAPNAKKVSVMGDFNFWNKEEHPMAVRWDGSGIWEIFVYGVEKGANYKYHIVSHNNNYTVDKGDPYALFWEIPPKTASTVWQLDYKWQDGAWMQNRHVSNSLDAPISIYEAHLGSWKRVPEGGDRYLTYRELAHELADYVKNLGYTHIELLPITEHPFFASWGYQTVGYFAPTSRYGTPEDFMYFVDYMHQNGIGVILDWVPAHFPSDEHGLCYFDGTALYEHADPKQGFHPDWGSYIFNFGRNEVKNFLIGSALFWLDKYHLDGLRVDAVASMLYLDYSRNEGEWIPNIFGGRENLEAIDFIKKFNEEVYKNHPDVLTVAEESTAWPMVSKPTYIGGLGFKLKWNMGWMHDTLKYMSEDPVFRKYHHNQLTFGLLYSFTENFMLPLSHDEVVHGKGSLLNKMPGDEWQKHANLRLLYGYMYGYPGKKLLFMGGEFAPWDEWKHDHSLDWHLTQYLLHNGTQKLVQDLNHIYKTNPCLYDLDFTYEGFDWIDFQDWEGSIISFVRKNHKNNEMILVVCNFTPVPRESYAVGVPKGGYWKEILNTDAKEYGGSGMGNSGGIQANIIQMHGKPCSLNITIPPLSALFFKNAD